MTRIALTRAPARRTIAVTMIRATPLAIVIVSALAIVHPARGEDLPPAAMPRDHKEARPKPRAKAEVDAVLAGAPNPPEKARPIKIVLAAGKKDHGKGEHDYPAWQKAWAELFKQAKGVEVHTAWEWPTKEQFAAADAIVFYQHGDWTPERAADVDAFLARGGGLVYIHWAVDGRTAPGAEDFAKRIGLAAPNGNIKYRHGPLDLKFNAGAKHPISRNFAGMKFVDESYWRLLGALKKERVIATQEEDGADHPLFWTVEHGADDSGKTPGRVFVSIPGHYSWTFDDPLFRVLILRGIAWTAREPVDRFNDLVWIGAEYSG
jgi:hypothetical protein